MLPPKKLYEQILSAKETSASLECSLGSLIELSVDEPDHRAFMLHRLDWFHPPLALYMPQLAEVVRLETAREKQYLKVSYHLLCSGLWVSSRPASQSKEPQEPETLQSHCAKTFEGLHKEENSTTTTNNIHHISNVVNNREFEDIIKCNDQDLEEEEEGYERFSPALQCIILLFKETLPPLFVQCLKENTPHKLQPYSSHEPFMRALLTLVRLYPSTSLALISLIFTTLVSFDTEIITNESNLIPKLDGLMCLVVRQIGVLLKNISKASSISPSLPQTVCNTILEVFTTEVLCITRCKYVQWVLFVLCEQHKNLRKSFLATLLSHIDEGLEARKQPINNLLPNLLSPTHCRTPKHSRLFKETCYYLGSYLLLCTDSKLLPRISAHLFNTFRTRLNTYTSIMKESLQNKLLLLLLTVLTINHENHFENLGENLDLFLEEARHHLEWERHFEQSIVEAVGYKGIEANNKMHFINKFTKPDALPTFYNIVTQFIEEKEFLKNGSETGYM